MVHRSLPKGRIFYPRRGVYTTAPYVLCIYHVNGGGKVGSDRAFRYCGTARNPLRADSNIANSNLVFCASRLPP